MNIILKASCALQEDDSLRRWKEKLLGCVESDLNGLIQASFYSISDFLPFHIITYLYLCLVRPTGT